jgi:hypothetical protein
LRETAERNAHLRKLVDAVRQDVHRSITVGGTDELTAALRDTLDLLDAVATDLIESRAEGAVAYETNAEFRRIVDEARAQDE